MEALGATRVATICDKINEQRDAGKPMSVRKVAAISAMIDDITDGDQGMPPRRASTKKKARKGSARWSEEVSRLNERKPGFVVKSGNDVSGILREACFTAACRGHPSIVGYGGVTLTPGSTDEYSLVYDQLEPSLADVMRGRGRPFPEADARRVMHQLLSAAKATEERGIVHRDINPANILFDAATGAAKISNFSAAKSTAEKKEPPPPPTLLFAGTNGYTAPEVLLRNPNHDAAADAWSLGCVMMDLIVGGKVLFKGNDESDQLYRIFDVLGVPGKKAR